jgi:hypothetical protein
MTNLARDWNEAYLRLHVPKEDLYWSTYMGLGDDGARLAQAETALKKYVSDPAQLPKIREDLRNAQSESDRVALAGWLRFFESNTIEDVEARAILSELIEMERVLFEKRAALRFDFRDASGKTHQASVNVLGVNVSTSPDPVIRRSSYESLLGLEQWVLANGYLELVKKRNSFARRLGFSNFFSYKLQHNEGLSEAELDAIFGPFEIVTREKCFSEFRRIANEMGPDALSPWELMFRTTGGVSAEMDPYFPFSKSIARWGLSFARLGIRFREANLTLDLLERTGKYENGFMHGPMPSYFDEGKWVPARINFTSNATPDQVGNGYRMLQTLFHEGGHAAHFSNVLQPSPSFSQEFPPTSMAYAETQSMFCDSLVRDADWMKRYAKNRAGDSMSDELIRRKITASQPLRAYSERAILVIPHFEKRLYSMADSELTPANVTHLARRSEKEIFDLDGVARPILAVPHLLSDSGACSYQGYLLANMAVYQTRAYFKEKYGWLTDEPRIGPEIATAYWSSGNAVAHSESVRRLTGQALDGAALASECNATNDEIWKRAVDSIATLAKRPEKIDLASVDLDANIRVIHGTDTIAEQKTSFAQLAHDFEGWIDSRYPT